MERVRIETAKPRGRPRSTAADAAILAASVALVREVGYDAVTMEAIALEAGVGKATLYRRWSDKEALVSEAVGRIVGSISIPDAGSASTELLALMRATVRLYEDPATLELLSGLVAAMARSPRIARAVRHGFIKAWNDALISVLKRGIERGDLRRKLDVDLMVDMLGGCFSNRALITARAIDDSMARALVDIALNGMGAE